MALIAETTRLTLREFTVDDAAFALTLLNSPGWIAFIGDLEVRTTEQAASWMERSPLKSYREHGHGLYVVVEKASGRPIGGCGLMRRAGLAHPDIGFAFLPAYMGRGYAYEAASKVMAMAHDYWGMEVLEAIVLPTNLRSIRLLEKLGMAPAGRVRLPGDEEELLRYHTQLTARNIP